MTNDAPQYAETMTSRERVLAAIEHRIPDRVPIDLGGNQTGIHKFAYKALLEHLGIEDQTTIMDAVQQLAEPCEAVLERFRVDTRYIAAKAPDNFQGDILLNNREGRLWHDLRDEFGVVWSMPDDQPYYMDISHHPLAEATIADVADYAFPRGADPSRFAGLRERAQMLRDETPYAVVSRIAGVVYEYCWYMRGLERWFMDMLTEPEFCEALLDQMLKFWMDWFRVFLDEVGDLVDVIMIGDDLAGQHGPLFRPEFYRTIVKPRQKQLVQYIRSRTEAKIWYHTCGSCITYIPDLMDNGVDILNPVQVSAKDMDPTALKADFGERLVFWGGAIDSQHVLPSASPETVRKHVRGNLEALKPQGGYVFNNVHNIQAGVPPENIVALYDAAYEYGFYG
ncbi:MAG: uroporphyrinogen decarboxylase family protein [Planctomycetota bacterium]|nr:uroporphyrinogen decarboxylase family protein [Planctomycetota bacterium]